MRSGDENDGSIAWDFPRAAGVYFAEEKVNQDRKYPQQDVVDDIVHGRQLSTRRSLPMANVGPVLRHGGRISGNEDGELEREQLVEVKF